MPSHRAPAAALALLLAASAFGLSGLPGAAAPSLPPVLEMPPWAVGFFWTYHFDGAYDLSFGGFTASRLNDTYTSSVIAEVSTARGDAWLIRNVHEGTAEGSAMFGPVALPGTADITSETFSYVRKSDQAVLNFTQDLWINATIQTFGTLNARVHNESFADPPLARLAWGHATDGSPWRVVSNLSQTGWYQIGATPPVYSSSYLAIDYNLSVLRTSTVAVPAGTFDAYNISGFGTVDANGTVYNYTESSLWSPKAQASVVDEAGYSLMSLFVNRPPGLLGPIGPVHVVSPGYNDTVDVSSFVDDPESGPVTFSSCAAEPPLACTLSPGGALNLSAPAGVNATLNVTFLADDGLPSGNATLSLVALVRGASSANGPPAFGGASLAMDEDSELTLDPATLFTDPEGDPVSVIVRSTTDLYIVAQNGSTLRLRPPTDYNGPASMRYTAYDTAGNGIEGSIAVTVRPVGDAPRLVAVSGPSATMHAGVGSSLFEVAGSDVDGDTLTFGWDVDGQAFDGGTAFDFAPAANVSAGTHPITVVASDGTLSSNRVAFTVFIFEGPRITTTEPGNASFRVANNTTFPMGVNASDADSPILHYRWTLDNVTFAEADNTSSVRPAFNAPGAHRVRVVVSDNATNASFEWAVHVEEAPPGLVTVYSPIDGAELEPNATVDLIVVVDPRLNVTFEWRLDGTVVSTEWNDTTDPLTPGNHTIALRVRGTYNQMVVFDDSYSFAVRVKSPAAPNGTNGGNNSGNNGGNNTGCGAGNPCPADQTPLYLLAVLAAAAAAAAFIVYRRRRNEPPREPPAKPPAA